MKHLLKISDLGQGSVTRILQLAYQYQNGETVFGMLPRSKILATLFFEPSTRTRLSFEAAMLRLGGSVVSASDLATTSCAKGESLEDTIKIVSESYADIIVVRHPEAGAVEQAAAYSNVPIVNGGDGTGEHPTQALCDLYALWDACNGDLTGRHVILYGDIHHSRAAHSFITLLEMMGVTHREIPYHDDDCGWLGEKKADAVYIIRPQLERAHIECTQDYNWEAKTVIETTPDAKIMHPLPRTGEISKELDKDPRSIYFEQAKAGVPIRTVLLAHLLGIIQL